MKLEDKNYSKEEVQEVLKKYYYEYVEGLEKELDEANDKISTLERSVSSYKGRISTLTNKKEKFRSTKEFEESQRKINVKLNNKIKELSDELVRKNEEISKLKKRQYVYNVTKINT